MTKPSAFDEKPCDCGQSCAEQIGAPFNGYCRNDPPLMRMLRELNERLNALESGRNRG